MDGVYNKTADGFSLEFAIGEDKFTLAHAPTQTTVKACGVMSYDITLRNHEHTSTTLSAPFGMVKFDMQTELRKIEQTEGAMRIMLFYILRADGVGGGGGRSVDLQIHYSELS